MTKSGKTGINQDKPAAQESCSLFVILSHGGTIIITPQTAIQPPPSLPRRGGTDTIVSIIVYMCVWDVRQCPRGTDTLVAYYQKVIDNQSNLQLPVFDKAE